MLDPITLEVVRNRLQYLTQEMSAAIVKTAVSPVVSEARDFSCMLYDADGHIVATAATVPFHFGVSADAIAVVRERFAGRIVPGDVFLANDPHDGGGLHLQDVVVMRPIFRNRTRIGWASTSGHMIDMGGLVPGSFAPNARECYQEGVRVPPTRILRAGEPVDDVWNLILNNVRQRETVEMDLRSLVAGTHVAAEQVCELEAEVGPPAFRQALREIRGLSARVVRRRIRELPTGEYVEQGWAEFDDEAFLVRCRLRVGDGMLEFDYTGSSPQCPYFFNSKPHIVRSELVVRLHQLLAADVPFTDGVLAPVRVVAPEGSIVNARPPAPVAAAHMHVALLAMELGETCLKKALACALPRDGLASRQRRITAPGGTTGMGLSSWHGRTHDGTAETFLVMDGNAVGAGACSDRDGIDMTGSKQAEAAVRRSESELRSFVEHAPYGIGAISVQQDRFLRANPALVKMLGYKSEAEVLALTVSHDLDSEGQSGGFRAQLTRADYFNAVEFTWKRNDGKPVSVRASGRRISRPEHSGDILEIIAEDLTAPRILEEQLRHAQKMEAL